MKPALDTLWNDPAFRSVADSIPAFLSYVDGDEQYQFVNRQYEERFGLSRQAIIGKSVRDLFGEENYGKIKDHIGTVRSGQALSYEWSASLPDGDRWMSVHYSPERDRRGRVQGFVVFATDLTELRSRPVGELQLRELAARLIHAKEISGLKIAQELHGLTDRITSVHLRTEQRDPLPILTADLTGLSQAVQALSRRVHPVLLYDLGLERALRSECTNFAKRHSIAVGFTATAVPQTLPDEVALCLFRVFEEGLSNIRAHSGARDAKISLTATGDSIRLRIEDAGKGFDQGNMEGSEGLGLVTIEERVRILNGTVSLRSASGHGTSLEVSLPIRGRAGD